MPTRRRLPTPNLLRRRLYGSAILRTAVWGALAAAQTGLLYAFADDYVSRFFQDGRIVVYSLFVALMSLLVIFRQNARRALGGGCCVCVCMHVCRAHVAGTVSSCTELPAPCPTQPLHLLHPSHPHTAATVGSTRAAPSCRPCLLPGWMPVSR